jgi:hypothetical protein
MKMKIQNFSRHELNTDQKEAILDAFPRATFGPALAPFFKDASDLASKINGKTSVAVIPGALLLDTIAGQMIASGTSILVFDLDQAARKRGRFAARGLKVFEFVVGVPSGIVQLHRTWHKTIVPTIENSFSDGEEFVYDLVTP